MSAKPDPAELLSLLMAVVRADASPLAWGLMEEFRKCANGSSAGSNAEHFSLTPTQRVSLARDATSLPSGHGMSAKPIEETWWTEQDKDTAWARQWENDTDTSDPKSYK